MHVLISSWRDTLTKLGDIRRKASRKRRNARTLQVERLVQRRLLAIDLSNLTVAEDDLYVEAEEVAEGMAVKQVPGANVRASSSLQQASWTEEEGSSDSAQPTPNQQGEPVPKQTDPRDVNRDGDVTPLDALLIVHAINVGDVEIGDASYLDVDHNGALTPGDFLSVAQYLNAAERAPEGNAAADAASQAGIGAVIDEDMAVAALKRIGVRLGFNDAGRVNFVDARDPRSAPFTDTEMVYIAALPELETLDVSRPEVTDLGIARIRGLPKLSSLIISSSCTDDVIAHLETLPGLRELRFAPEAAITPAGVAQIGRLTKLTALGLPWGGGLTEDSLRLLKGLTQLKYIGLPPQLTDHGLSYLKQFPRLQYLQISHCTRVTDAGLRHVADLTELRSIWLPPGITDQGLAHLAGLQDVRELVLHDTAVTDAGLQAVRGMGGLEYLSLPEHVTDAGLVHLRGLPLRFLHHPGTTITDEGVQPLKDALADLVVLVGRPLRAPLLPLADGMTASVDAAFAQSFRPVQRLLDTGEKGSSERKSMDSSEEVGGATAGVVGRGIGTIGGIGGSVRAGKPLTHDAGAAAQPDDGQAEGEGGSMGSGGTTESGGTGGTGGTGGSGGSGGSGGTGAAIWFESSDATIEEEDTNMDFEIRWMGGTQGGSVMVTAEEGTPPDDPDPHPATDDVLDDFTGVTQGISFSAQEIAQGITTKTFSVPIHEDNLVEYNEEKFKVTLEWTDEHGDPQDDTVYGTITEDMDSTLYSIEPGNPPSNEGDLIGPGVNRMFRVNLTNPVDIPFSVEYHTFDGTAIAGEDYVGTTHTIDSNSRRTRSAK